MSRLDWHSDTRRRPWLASFTGLIAILAFAGAVSLMTGVIALGTEVEARIPFHSPVLAGIALAVIVGVPMSDVCYLAMRPDSRTAVAAVVAGALLIGWIVAEIAYTQTYSWLQPVFAFAGVAVVVAGLQELRRV
ncbi:hypothetical protein [Amycolatopsis alkalitolerans]|uniref:Uncharacterized protein n=1 Tax=Amycolatopsis alkalitolerans TaxID=2547244 RepID=A0A5C4M1Z5_9PSEU|nr:hypothetical protein [Amycolatopsis alkalitolerans]TNC24825.1 hypothetical protein FG385_16385 [Amycolatopsis alkalitolerans]